jgi:hypothetical protein
LFTRFVADPMEPGLLQRLQETIELVLTLPFQVRLWEAQNTYYRIMQEQAGKVSERAESGDPEARAWLEEFVKLGDALKVRVQINAAVSV